MTVGSDGNGSNYEYTSSSNEIDVNYVLAIIDACLFLWAAFQLARIFIYSKKGLKNLKPKLIFHCIIAVSMFVRSGFFFALPTFNKDPIRYYTASLIWFDLSSVLIFAGYGCLLLFWMELYSRFNKPYSTSKDFWEKWTPYIIGFSIVLGAAIVTWLLLLIFWAQEPIEKVILDYVSEGTICGLFLAAGAGFLCFGILLFISIKRLNRMSDSLQSGHKLSLQKRPPPPEAIQAAVVASICTVCFCLRSIFTLYSIKKNISYDDEKHASSTDIISTKFNMDWEMQLLYFFFTEILPTILMMFRLRKMKKTKVNPLLVNNGDDINAYTPFTSTYNTFVKNIQQPKSPFQNISSSFSSSSPSSRNVPQSPISSLQNSSSFTNYSNLNSGSNSNYNTLSSSSNNNNNSVINQPSNSYVNSPIISYQNPNMISPI